MHAVPDLAALPALDPFGAALSGIGPRGRKDGPVATTATREVLRALEPAGVRRIVVVSAAPVGPVPADLTAMEEELRSSGADRTAVRPPKLTDRPATGKCRQVIGGSPRGGYPISRADTANAMLAALDDPATIRQPVGVAY